MDAQQALPQISEVHLNALGQRLGALWPIYVSDRRVIEERWLKNLRAVRKIHDPEVLAMIPADRSKAYPGVTQWMVRGTIARLMQLLFPMTEKNYGIKNSPIPDLPTEQLQKVLDQLVASKQPPADPANPQAAQPVSLTDEEIEKAIVKFAAGKAENMERKVNDDLQEMEFITLARKVVRSAVIYNIGLLKGPLHKEVKSRKWQQDTNTGQWKAVEVTKYKPLFEFCPVWGYYPDMTAVDIARQDGEFERHIMTRSEVEQLINRPDFIGQRITDYLNDHVSGNYQPQWWETLIKGEPKSGQASVMNKDSRKFELISYLGNVTGAELRGAGVTIAEGDLGKSFRSNVWMIGELVIKCRLMPLGDTINQYHKFIFEDDDLSILGSGQCDVVRDSALSVGECARAMLDNMSVIGPMVEVNEDLLSPGQSKSIAKHKTWMRESQGGNSDSIPAVRNINVESHIQELKVAIEMFMGFAQQESGLPPASLGDTSGGGTEALRTTKNASMFLGAAALPIRDTVRNYDTFTVSVISALVAWNQKYDPNPTRDGDHDVIARGSTSLIAKEVLSTNLNEFRATLAPDEVPYIKTREMLLARMKANDLPTDDILEDVDVANQKIKDQAQAAQQAQQGQLELIQAQAKAFLTKALENEAKAQSEGAKVSAKVFDVVMKAINDGHAIDTEKVKTVIAAHQADSTRITAEKPAPTGGSK